MFLILGLVVIGEIAGVVLGRAVRGAIRNRGLRTFDSIIGVGLQLVAVLDGGVAAWPLRSRRPISSRIWRRWCAVRGCLPRSTGWHRTSLKSVKDRLKALLNTSGLPDVLPQFGRTPIVNVDIPDATLADDPVVAATRPSVLKIRGVATSCQKVLEGSGFVVAPNRVMSNAHVVAGSESVTVEVRRQDVRRDRGVVRPQRGHLHPRRARSAVAALQFDMQEAPTGTDAVVMGYPGGGDFTATPAGSARSSSSTGRTSTTPRRSPARSTPSEALCGRAIRVAR